MSMSALRPPALETLAIATIAVATVATATFAMAAPADEAGWIALFDGRSLDGWHVSAKTGHSRASHNTSGGRWVV